MVSSWSLRQLEGGIKIERLEKSVRIAASKESVFRVISDYERYPDWMPDMLRSKVISREGSRTVCAFNVGGLKRINYTLELEHQEYDAIRFRQVTGDLRHYQGMWRLESPPDASETLVVCRMEIDPGLPVPGWIVKRTIAKQLSDNLQALKKRAESGIADAVPEEVEHRPLDQKEISKGEREKILEVVRRGQAFEIWFMGKRYTSSVSRSMKGHR